VRQHHAGAADADTFGDGRYGGDQDLGRSADDSRVVVVLGDPESVVAEGLAGLCQRDGIANRDFMRTAGNGNGLVENGEMQARFPFVAKPTSRSAAPAARLASFRPRVHVSATLHSRERSESGWISALRCLVCRECLR